MTPPRRGIPGAQNFWTQQDPGGLYGVQEYSHQEKGRKREEIIEIELLALPRNTKI